MVIDAKIKDEKLPYGINRAAAKILVLSPGKINKYEFVAGEEILPSDQSRIIEQVSSRIILSVKHLRNKYKQLKIKEWNKLKL